VTERSTSIPLDPETEEGQSDNQARPPRRSPQFDKCLEAIEALQATGEWLPNGARGEQYSRICSCLTAKGYEPAWLPSLPTFSRAVRFHERDNRQ
jgi:hypothetical protein